MNHWSEKSSSGAVLQCSFWRAKLIRCLALLQHLTGWRNFVQMRAEQTRHLAWGRVHQECQCSYVLAQSQKRSRSQGVASLQPTNIWSSKASVGMLISTSGKSQYYGGNPRNVSTKRCSLLTHFSLIPVTKFPLAIFLRKSPLALYRIKPCSPPDSHYLDRAAPAPISGIMKREGAGCCCLMWTWLKCEETLLLYTKYKPGIRIWHSTLVTLSTVTKWMCVVSASAIRAEFRARCHKWICRRGNVAALLYFGPRLQCNGCEERTLPCFYHHDAVWTCMAFPWWSFQNCLLLQRDEEHIMMYSLSEEERNWGNVCPSVLLKTFNMIILNKIQDKCL